MYSVKESTNMCDLINIIKLGEVLDFSIIFVDISL